MSSNSHQKGLTVSQFCRLKTNATELCIIRDSGYIVAAVYIDHEDIFRIEKRLAEAIVKNDYYGTINLWGMENVPCHYIET